MSAKLKPEAPLSRRGRSALIYAQTFGWRVFPLHHNDDAGMCSCGNAECGGPGKHPRTPRGCLDASADPKRVREWWTRWPEANVGVATGQGLVVIDIDPRSGGDDGLVDLRRTLGEIPHTVECLTGGGGRHLYLRVDADVRNSASVLAPGVDVRGEGGYVVAPPSSHESGGVYAWELSSRPDENDVAQAPPAWLAALTTRPKLRALPGGKGEPFPEGARNASLFKRAASMRAAGFDYDAILAAIMAENDTRCVPPLDPAEVKAIAASAAKYPEGLSDEVRTRLPRTARSAALDDGLSPAQPPNETGDWQEDLFRTPKGAIRNTFANVCAILRHAENYAEHLRYNEMRISPTIDGKPIDDADAGAIRESIERTYGFSPGADALGQALVTVSSERKYHPVREYLNALSWGGAPRIERVCAEILNADPSAINQTVLRAWFVSAVARAMEPGCKVDTALVLVGPQGARKSSFYRELAGEWFSDTAVDIENKDAMMQINGAWIYELGEIEHVTGRAHAGRIKAFMSSQCDTFRAPFMRTVAAYPRHCIVVGSTNEDQFLTDPTGSRRFWCVSVGGRIDIATLREWRGQLWAEAVALYRANEAWWLSPEAEGALRESAERFRVSDPWETAIARWLDEQDALPASQQTPITSARILGSVLGMVVEKHDQRASNRVAAIMSQLGWRNRPETVEGRTARVWRRREAP